MRRLALLLVLVAALAVAALCGGMSDGGHGDKAFASGDAVDTWHGSFEFRAAVWWVFLDNNRQAHAQYCTPGYQPPCQVVVETTPHQGGGYRIQTTNLNYQPHSEQNCAYFWPSGFWCHTWTWNFDAPMPLDCNNGNFLNRCPGYANGWTFRWWERRACPSGGGYSYSEVHTYGSGGQGDFFTGYDYPYEIIDSVHRGCQPAGYYTAGVPEPIPAN